MGSLVDFFGNEWMGADRNMVTDPFGDVQAAETQQQAQKDALAQQVSLAKQAQDFFKGQSDQGIGYIQQGTQQGEQALQDYLRSAGDQIGQGRGYAQSALEVGRNQGLESLGAGYTQGRGDIAGGYAQGRGDLASAYGQARGDLGQVAGLQRYGAGAAQAINSYDALGQRQDRLGGMLDQRGGLYGGFEQDPGYQFRQKQGEEAIMRQASAQGGRMGGATMKALADYNQGLASQEYGNFAARRQAEAGVNAGSDTQYAGLLTNQAGRTDQASLAAQQNQMGLAGMGYGAQGQLAGLASQYGQGQAGMSTAGGQALGGMAYGYGGQRAGMQGQYGQNLADMYQQTYGQQAGMTYGTGNSLSDLYSNAGGNMANVAIGVGGNNQNNANSLMGAYSNYAQYGGMEQQAQANSNRETAGMIAGFFSDSRLKSDIRRVIGSKYERIGLNGYTWEWNTQANRLGYFGKSGGVIAQEVREVYPSAVVEQDGYLAVDYPALEIMVESEERAHKHRLAGVGAEAA